MPQAFEVDRAFLMESENVGGLRERRLRAGLLHRNRLGQNRDARLRVAGFRDGDDLRRVAMGKKEWSVLIRRRRCGWSGVRISRRRSERECQRERERRGGHDVTSAARYGIDW